VAIDDFKKLFQANQIDMLTGKSWKTDYIWRKTPFRWGKHSKI